MVIPWVGFPLKDLLARFKPTSRAKYVAFQTLYAPDELPGQRIPVYDWPYREGLRMDEAVHPLTILATGLYGEVLPGQNGAPLRRHALAVFPQSAAQILHPRWFMWSIHFRIPCRPETKSPQDLYDVSTGVDRSRRSAPDTFSQ